MKNAARTVWITGASSGIGRALAKTFASNGDSVIATARSEDKLDQLRSELESLGHRCDVYRCDVQQESSIRATIQFILEKYSTVDLLINNAGVTYFKSFLDTTTEEFDHTIGTNLKGAFLCTKAVLPVMLAKNAGLILNIVSVTVKSVFTNSAVYAASKAGLQAMMDVLRAEVRGKGIQIVNAFPGAVLTPIWHPRQQEKYHDRMIEPDRIAELLFQVSHQPSSMMVEEIVIRPQMGDL